jgi:hypothetical protein
MHASGKKSRSMVSGATPRGRRDNTPENFQGNETYSAVEQAVEDLGSLSDEVEGVVSSFENIEFPGW